MTEVRRRALARSLQPLPEESLPGYILRLAYRLGQSPARVGELCGLSTLHRRLPADYLRALPAQPAHALAESARLTPTEVQALTFAGSGLTSTYAPLGSPNLNQGCNYAATRRRWAMNLSSRFCPRCLAGDGTPVQNALGGAWKLRWHLPVVFACPEHSVLLSAVCPHCHNAPNRPPRTERVGLLMERARTGTHPAQCRHPLPATQSRSAGTDLFCAGRLDRTVPGPPEMTPQDLGQIRSLQLRINQRLFPEHPQPGRSTPHYFPDLIAIAHLIKFSWPAGAGLIRSAHLAALVDTHAMAISRQLAQPLHPGPRPSSPWPAPDDPAQSAALLLAADTLLDYHEGDGTNLREHVQLLARTAFDRLPPNMAAGFRRMDFSPNLARALARRTNGFYQAGGHRNAKLHAPSRECSFSGEHVPALLPADLFTRHFSELCSEIGPLTEWNARHLRRAASLKLVEMAAGGTWSACARTLALPWNTTQQSLKVLKHLFATTASREPFDRAVEQVARTLDGSTPRISYAQRRRTLATWQLPEDDWAALCEGLTTLKGRPTSPSSQAATALVWAHVTQGDYLHSPVLTALRRAGESTTRLVAAVNQTRRASGSTGDRTHLLHRLGHYADQVALVCDQSPGSAAAPA